MVDPRDLIEVPEHPNPFKPLTPLQITALRAMPIRLNRDGCLPSWGPSGGTIKALADRGLIRSDGRRWTLTPKGESERAWMEDGQDA